MSIKDAKQSQRECGHCFYLGKSGSGMSVTKQQTAQLFLASSDVSQLKDMCSGESGEKLADVIRNNCSVRFSLKHRDEHHDK